MFLAVGRERGTFQLGQKTIDLAIRTSRIYKKNGHGLETDPPSWFN